MSESEKQDKTEEKIPTIKKDIVISPPPLEMTVSTNVPDVVISTSASDITVAACDKDNVEHENIYNESIPSDAIALHTAADLGFPPELSYQEKFIQGVEQVKGKYVEEFELEIGLPKFPLLKLKIKRAPEKIIKFFEAKEAKRKSKR